MNNIEKLIADLERFPNGEPTFAELKARVIAALKQQGGEPFGYIGFDAHTLIAGGEKVSCTFSPLKICDDDVPLYASPQPAQQQGEPVAWDDRPISSHIMETLNSTCTAWSDVRDKEGNIVEWKCQFASALEARLREYIKGLLKDAYASPQGDKK